MAPLIKNLSLKDLQRIQDAQRVLLAPLRYETPEAWLRDAACHVQAVMEADHAYASMPGDDGITLVGSDLDPEFLEDMRQSVQGLQEGGFPSDDPVPLQMHLTPRPAGAGLYHELALADRPTIELLPARQTLWPHEVEHITRLSVPLPVGEASICVAFKSVDAPGCDPAVGRSLELLMPAFEAGVKQSRCLAAAWSRFASLIDTLSDAVVLADADGTEQYGNRAFRALLEAEPDAEALRRAARRLATEAPTDKGLGATQHELTLAGGTYRLRAGHTPPDLYGSARTLVIVARVSPYPSPPALQDHFGLTPRETEVALLLAEGRSNTAIAEALFISPHTARHHVQKVLRKLGASSRAAVAHVLLHSTGHCS